MQTVDVQFIEETGGTASWDNSDWVGTKEHEMKLDYPIGYLYLEGTNNALSVYKKIPWFKRKMLYWCFGLRYEGIE